MVTNVHGDENCDDRDHHQESAQGQSDARAFSTETDVEGLLEVRKAIGGNGALPTTQQR